MRPAALTHAIGLAPVVDHLWQSTVVVFLAYLLVLVLRRHRASLRYWIWFAASMKFLLPFALLVQLGQTLRPAHAPSSIAVSSFTESIDYFANPFSQLPANLASDSRGGRNLRELLPYALLAVWFCGSGAVFFCWTRRRSRIRRALRTSLPSPIEASIPVFSTASTLEPGVFGLFKHVLLLPSGIAERLTAAELCVVIAHEMCHVRRRDNLTSALHMLVEALFWFHPLVWWIGARLVDERERACDEHVLSLGSDPQVYAESILKVCNFYLESPLFCAAGVTGSHLKKRIEAIMTDRALLNLSSAKKILLVSTAAAAVLVPLGFGVLHAAQNGGSQTLEVVTASFYNAPPLRVYEAVSVRRSTNDPAAAPAAEFRPDGFRATNVTLQMLIQQAYGVSDYQIAEAPQWLNRNRYDVEAKVSDSLTEELRKGDVNQLSARQQPMLLELLADNFHLSVHRETKQLPAYALVVSENGSKLREATPGDTYPNGIKDANGNGHGGVMSFHRGQLTGQGISLDLLVRELSHELGRPVLDRTGLTGNYDFNVQWSDGRVIASEYVVVSQRPGAKAEASRLGPVPQPSGPSLFTALRDQLGLDLVESSEQTAPTQILVVDHAEPPRIDDDLGREPQAEPALAFTSVSVKVNTTNTPMAGFNIKGTNFSAALFKPDRFMATNFTLGQLILTAYQVQEQQIVGAADWTNSEKYDVDARIDKDTAEKLKALGPEQGAAERLVMLQSLLANQFKFAAHRETRALPVYILTVADTGAKLRTATATSGDTYRNGAKGFGDAPAGPGHWTEDGKEVFQGMTVSPLVQFLANRLHRIVLDNTGLTARYDFTLQWTPIPPESSSPSIVGAVHDQLGLQLERKESPVEVLVIDRAEAPSPN